MKKILFTLSILFSSLFMFSQGSQQVVPETVKNQVAILKASDLKLTDVQLSRITTVLIAENDKLERSKKAVGINNQQLQERMKLHKEVMIKNIKGAMTPLQVEKFDIGKLGDKL